MRSFCRLTLGLRLDDSLLDAELSCMNSYWSKNPRMPGAGISRGPAHQQGRLRPRHRELSYAIEHGPPRSNSIIIVVSHDCRMSDYKAALGDFNRAAGHYELPRIPAQVLTGAVNVTPPWASRTARSLTSQR